MEKNEFEKAVTKEKNKLKRVLKEAKISAYKMKALEPVIINSAWMKAKLDEARAQAKESDIVVEYDNGGGQKGLRENPIFKAYEALWKSYMLGICRILDAIPDEAKKEVEAGIEEAKPQTVLEIVREKKNNTA